VVVMVLGSEEAKRRCRTAARDGGCSVVAALLLLPEVGDDHSWVEQASGLPAWAGRRPRPGAGGGGEGRLLWAERRWQIFCGVRIREGKAVFS
jgi:hypothetical protein